MERGVKRTQHISPINVHASKTNISTGYAKEVREPVAKVRTIPIENSRGFKDEWERMI